MQNEGRFGDFCRGATSCVSTGERRCILEEKKKYELHYYEELREIFEGGDDGGVCGGVFCGICGRDAGADILPRSINALQG